VTEISPGWYKDPADPTTQRYWDGGGWTGAPIPAAATPPDGPPPPEPEAVADPVAAPNPEAGHPVPVAEGPWHVSTATTSPPQPPGPLTAPPGWQYGYPTVYPGPAPAPRPHGLALAGLGARFVARMVDVIAVLLLCAIANSWFAIQFWQGMRPYYTEAMRRAMAGDTSTANLPTVPQSASTLLLVICFVTTAVWFAYEVPASANSGQTLGKRLLGIKVVRLETADQLGFGRSLRRWSRLGLPTLLWYCCIGFLLQFVDCLFVLIDRPLHQALHDKAAGTVVVQVPRPDPSIPGGRHADPT
jgi:uncharacterized RDD family membrane protein YckC